MCLPHMTQDVLFWPLRSGECFLLAVPLPVIVDATLVLRQRHSSFWQNEMAFSVYCTFCRMTCYYYDTDDDEKELVAIFTLHTTTTTTIVIITVAITIVCVMNYVLILITCCYHNYTLTGYIYWPQWHLCLFIYLAMYWCYINYH